MQRSDYGRISVVVILAMAVYYVARILQPFFPALMWAAILATVFHPVFERVSRLLRRPGLASARTCVLLTVAIVLPVMVLILLLAGESASSWDRSLSPSCSSWSISTRLNLARS